MHISIHWPDAVVGAYGLRIVAYAVATAPIPKNPWAQWGMSVLHFGLLNLDEGRQNLAAATGKTARVIDQNNGLSGAK